VKYAHIVGNGTSNNSRSNAHTLDWSGNAWYSGDVYVGSTSGKNKDEGSKKLATEEYVGNFFDGTIKYNEAQNLTAEEIEQARQNIHSAGVMTTGLEMRPFTVTALEDGRLFYAFSKRYFIQKRIFMK
jgi:hypothetical protein